MGLQADYRMIKRGANKRNWMEGGHIKERGEERKKEKSKEKIKGEMKYVDRGFCSVQSQSHSFPK